MRFPYKGAGIGFINQNGIFLGKRSKKPFLYTWAVPGGGFEKSKDKDFSECAIRELKEETSIDIKKVNAEFLGSWRLQVPFFCWTTYFYHTNADFNDLKLDEFSKVQWIPFDLLKNYRLRPFSLWEIKKGKKLLLSNEKYFYN